MHGFLPECMISGIGILFLISTTPVKNGAGTDTICGDWFGIVRNKHYMEVFIAENNTGHSRKLRIQYAADGAVGKDLVIEQQK
ncbi:MAG: hypothetical protein LUE93_06110 [Bacteroides sp.]|nr:hypothetical protein [Bacteroides sp.]